MKHTQDVFFTGSVTVKASGHHPELFFDLCAREGITVWNVKKINDTECLGNIRLSDIPSLKVLRRKTVYKLSFPSRRGLPFLIKKIFRQKPFVAGLLLSFLFVVFLSNIVWDVEIKGVHPEIEKKISQKLDAYGIQPGALKFTLGTPAAIQKRLLDDLPELLWVGVTEKGTTYQLEAVEKSIVEEQKATGPSNIVAAKKGVIVDMFVAKGLPLVKVNDVVEAGQVLVSGRLNDKKEQEDKNADKDDAADSKNGQLVSAEGDIFAETWYRVKTTIPLETSYQVLTGESNAKYRLKLGNLQIPVWGFKDADYEQTYKETNIKPIYFFKWTLPLSVVEEQVHEQESYQQKRTEDEARSAAVDQASKQLQTELGRDADISFQKVLHERIENGKVKLILYFKAKENISKIQPISQGD
ncbi:sporulation protein YqfD [Sediminibacillus albus]|uniref:Similar to stage IV sporulation protein n=1 Tax=Sediminibacillus albus TaxID=407036 RepID=A0A1G9CPH8_9BACI|nr:sporulation protein YqfD [Sediminibacillus albus]SDK53623.1 similar to stage IV sporulation protein [Sediminibacillus albus]